MPSRNSPTSCRRNCCEDSKYTIYHPPLQAAPPPSHCAELTTDHTHSPHPALGLDHGEARIGVAATDDFGILAHPVETIDQSKGDAIARIVRLVEIRKIRTLIVGLPVRMDGSEGTSAAKVRSFAELLCARIPGIPLVFVDETLTTSTAAAKLHAAGRSAKQQKGIIDQAAAVEILNQWLESLDSQ